MSAKAVANGVFAESGGDVGGVGKVNDGIMMGMSYACHTCAQYTTFGHDGHACWAMR